MQDLINPTNAHSSANHSFVDISDSRLNSGGITSNITAANASKGGKRRRKSKKHNKSSKRRRKSKKHSKSSKRRKRNHRKYMIGGLTSVTNCNNGYMSPGFNLPSNQSALAMPVPYKIH